MSFWRGVLGRLTLPSKDEIVRRESLNRAAPSEFAHRRLQANRSLCLAGPIDILAIATKSIQLRPTLVDSCKLFRTSRVALNVVNHSVFGNPLPRGLARQKEISMQIVAG